MTVEHLVEDQSPPGSLARWAVEQALAAPGRRGLLVAEQWEELRFGLIPAVLERAGEVTHQRTASRVEFPNGSRIELGTFARPDDLFKYNGSEFEFLGYLGNPGTPELRSQLELRLRGETRDVSRAGYLNKFW